MLDLFLEAMPRSHVAKQDIADLSRLVLIEPVHRSPGIVEGPERALRGLRPGLSLRSFKTVLARDCYTERWTEFSSTPSLCSSPSLVEPLCHCFRLFLRQSFGAEHDAMRPVADAPKIWNACRLHDVAFSKEHSCQMTCLQPETKGKEG